MKLITIVALTAGLFAQTEKQPQLASNGQNVWMAYGDGARIFVRASQNGGQTWSAPRFVGEKGKMSLGMRRGPRIASVNNTLVVSAIAGALGGGKDGDLWAWRSTDSGLTWSAPSLVNDFDGSAREGLHAMAGGGGLLYATWLDLRAKGTKLYGSISKDAGKTWSPNELVYESPEGTICQCCHPTLLVDSKGKATVMFRNALAGNRDMYAMPWGGKAQKIGEGNWELNACPMDGGALALDSDGTWISTWRRDKEVFIARPSSKEELLGVGRQPVISTTPKGLWAAWTDGKSLWVQHPDHYKEMLSPAASFPSITSLNDGSVLVAWEGASQIETKRLNP